MCRSGHEGGSTSARRCQVPEHRRQSHNAARMMTRIAALLQDDTLNAERRDTLKAAFMRHCNDYRELNGMGNGQYPPVPLSVSLVSEYTPEALDRLPYEVLDQRAMDAADNGDWALCELLCLEQERRDDLATRYPLDMEEAERARWAAMETAERRKLVAGLDPVTHPAARGGVRTKKEIEKVMRAEYETYIELEIGRAEEECRGNLFNAAGRNAALQGKSPGRRALWGNHVVAKAYASEELIRYWNDHPRVTFAAWQEMAAGRHGEAREGVAKSTLLSI